MKFEAELKGKVLYVDRQNVILGHNKVLYRSYDAGISWEKIFSIKGRDCKGIFINSSHLLSRLFRFGYHHIAVGNEDHGLIYNKKKAILKDNGIADEASLNSSRPFSLEYIFNSYVFGEYRSNQERSPIRVYSFDQNNMNGTPYILKNIRHIHGIYQDPNTGYIWVTTGDNDEESSIFRTKDNFKTLDKIVSGSQQTRTIKLLFTESYIYFGSDAPNEVNHLYRLDRKDHSVQKLQQVGSSVFHGCRVDKWLFFSTAIEPSSVNTSKYAEVWASPNGKDWKCIYKFKKDVFSMKYFQYGQIFFPNGASDNKNLWFSPFATKKSNKTYKVHLDNIKSRYDQC